MLVNRPISLPLSSGWRPILTYDELDLPSKTLTSGLAITLDVLSNHAGGIDTKVCCLRAYGAVDAGGPSKKSGKAKKVGSSNEFKY